MTETEDKVEEKTEFKFSELSDDAKEKARDTYRYRDGYPYDEWWEFVYEDTVRMAALLGITISTTTRKTTKGRSYQETDIWFSGFSSQGDGASFTGNYEFKADAVEQITQETVDEELIRIAVAFFTIQLTRRLQGRALIRATISQSSNYSHTYTMNVDVNSEDDNDQINQDVEDDVTQLIRDFADWIYKQLEAENDYLMSDEVVDQALADDLFDEDGCMI